MFASKVFLAVAIASVALLQIEAKPTTVVEDWTAQFETAFRNISSKVQDFVGDHSQFTESAKNGLNQFTDTLKTELGSLTKTLESKPDIANLVKESTKQWQTAVDSLTKNVPVELTPQKLNERFEETLKTITQNASELSKKVQGNGDVEKEIKDFTKKQYDALLEQYHNYQKKFTEASTPTKQ